MSAEGVNAVAAEEAILANPLSSSSFSSFSSSSSSSSYTILKTKRFWKTPKENEMCKLLNSCIVDKGCVKQNKLLNACIVAQV